MITAQFRTRRNGITAPDYRKQSQPIDFSGLNHAVALFSRFTSTLNFKTTASRQIRPKRLH